jgi:hypothetical protein
VSHRARWVLAGWVSVVALIVLQTSPARAQGQRYAVVVGNNVGGSEEGRLRYAEADARKVHDVLLSLGEFRPENSVLLLGEGAAAFDRVLIALNARIREERSRGGESVLFVYYSGHADASALHMGTERFELDRLSKIVRGSAAGFRLLLLDACRSGAITRVKGGRPAALFPLRFDARMTAEGVAFLTSSSANEDAQESDLLRGSFFTHFFVSGLRGAADTNRDGVVSVEEGYGYAYSHTLNASSQSLEGVQHPTFRFDVKGRGAVALTFVSAQDSRRAELKFPPGRSYMVFVDEAGGSVVGEVGEQDSERRLVVAPGPYFVRGRARDYLLEGRLTVGSGASLTVDDDRLTRVEYARLARKGGTSRTVAHGPWLGVEWRSPWWSESSPCPGLRAGYAIDTSSLTVTPRIGFCRSHSSNDTVEAHTDELDLDVALSYVSDLPGFSVAPGVAVGGAWLRQRFQTRGVAPGRDTAALHLDALVDFGWDLPAGFFLLGEAGGQLYVFEEQETGTGPKRTVAKPAARFVAAAGKRF